MKGAIRDKDLHMELFPYTKAMIKRIITKKNLGESSVNDDLEYWLSRSPEERISAVEFLRRQYYGNTARLQRSARIVKQKQS